MDNFKVDIVVPVYNEAENFRIFYDLISKNVKSSWRMLVIYDFPEDSTLMVAKPTAEKDQRVRLVINPERGALNAVKRGFKAAESEAVLEMMVDDPPEVIAKIDELVRNFYEKNATIAVASRYMKGGARRGGPFLKGIISRLAGISLSWLIGIPTRDATYNTRLYSKSFLDNITIESQMGFEVALEITVKAYLLGGKIIEIPVIWAERTVGKSKFKMMKWLPAYLRWYWYGVKNYWLCGWKKNHQMH